MINNIIENQVFSYSSRSRYKAKCQKKKNLLNAENSGRPTKFDTLIQSHLRMSLAVQKLRQK